MVSRLDNDRINDILQVDLVNDADIAYMCPSGVNPFDYADISANHVGSAAISPSDWFPISGGEANVDLPNITCDATASVIALSICDDSTSTVLFVFYPAASRQCSILERMDWGLLTMKHSHTDGAITAT